MAARIVRVLARKVAGNGNLKSLLHIYFKTNLTNPENCISC